VAPRTALFLAKRAAGRSQSLRAAIRSTKGIAGLTTGCPTKNVKFRVPLNEFVRIFAGLAFETDAPNE
jgi:hypothetical protein